MTKRKAKYGIQRGGTAYPLEGNIFMLNGKSHKQGGIDIDRTVEAQGGEIMRRFGPDNMQILSKEDNFIHGNPVKNYLNGMSFDNAFKLQQIDNVLQGRKNSIYAKYGVETEYDRIKRTMSKKKTASKSPSFGDRVRAASMLVKAATSESKKKLGNAARTIGELADYVYSGEIADDAAGRVGIDTKGGAKKVMNGVWSGLEQSPMGTGMRVVNNATSKIKDDDLRAMASIVPLMLGGGRMKSARRGAAGTGGGGRGTRSKKTSTAAQTTLNFGPNYQEMTPIDLSAGKARIKSKGYVKGSSTHRPVIKNGKTVYETNAENAKQSVNAARGNNERINNENISSTANSLLGGFNELISMIENNARKRVEKLAAKKEQASKSTVKFPDRSTSAEDVKYYKEQGVAEHKRTREIRKEKAKEFASLEPEWLEGSLIKGKARNRQLRRGKVDKNTIIYPRRYGVRGNRKTPNGKYTAEDLIYNTWYGQTGSGTETPAYMRNKFGSVDYEVSGDKIIFGETNAHSPKAVYEGMKRGADKKKGKTTTTTPTRRNTTSETTTTANNSSKVSTAKKWGKRVGYGAAGTAGVGLLVNAFVPRNKNAGFTNSDAYGVDENLSGRFVTVDPDERDIDTIGSIGEGMHNDTVLGKIYDANGDTTKLKQISDTTRQDTARRKKNKYGGVSSLRGIKNNRIKAPFGIDEWDHNYDWNLGYDGLPLVLYNNSAAYRKRLGYETLDVNIDHTNGTGNTSPRLSNIDIPWLSTSTAATSASASVEPKTPVAPKATPMRVNTSDYKINYTKTNTNNNNNGLFNDIDKRWNRHNNTQAIVSGIGSLASLIPTYLTYRNSIKNNPYNTSMMFEPYVKFNTYYNINPQISQLRESFGLANRNIRANTESSQNTLNRINNALNNMNSGINEQHAIKENKENESINKEIEFNAGVNQRNTSAYNDRTLEGAKYNAAAINGLYTGIGDFIQSLGDTYKNYSNNRMNYLKDNITARMILSKYYKPMAEQVVPEILKKYGVSPLVG